MKYIATLIFLVGIIATTGIATAGLVEINKDGSKTVVSNGRLKSIDEDGNYFVANSKNGTYMFVDMNSKNYMHLKVNECASDANPINGMKNSMMDNMSTEQQKMMNEAPEAAEADDKKLPPRVSIIKVGDGGKIAGYSTVLYRVIADDNPYEEIWISNDPIFKKEISKINYEVMDKIFECMNPYDEGEGVEQSPEYKKLLKSGWVLKSQSFKGEDEFSHEAKKIEVKNIPDSDFDIPHGYQKVTTPDFMKGR